MTNLTPYEAVANYRNDAANALRTGDIDGYYAVILDASTNSGHHTSTLDKTMMDLIDSEPVSSLGLSDLAMLRNVLTTGDVLTARDFAAIYEMENNDLYFTVAENLDGEIAELKSADLLAAYYSGRRDGDLYAEETDLCAAHDVSDSAAVWDWVAYSGGMYTSDVAAWISEKADVERLTRLLLSDSAAAVNAAFEIATERGLMETDDEIVAAYQSAAFRGLVYGVTPWDAVAAIYN